MVTIMAKAVKGAAVANGSVSRSICDKPEKTYSAVRTST